MLKFKEHNRPSQALILWRLKVDDDTFQLNATSRGWRYDWHTEIFYDGVAIGALYHGVSFGDKLSKQLEYLQSLRERVAA